MHCGSTSAVRQDLAQGESVARVLSGDPPVRGRSRKTGQQGPRKLKETTKKKDWSLARQFHHLPPVPCSFGSPRTPRYVVRVFFIDKSEGVVGQESLGYILRGSGGEPTTDQGKVPAGLLTAEVPT